MKLRSLLSRILILAIAGAKSISSPAFAQSVPSDVEPNPVPAWKALGFDDAPKGYSTHQIPLFEGLNKSRGGWSFRGSISESDTTRPLEGRMQISGSFKDGMFPMWQLALGWPAEEPEQVVSYTILASPEANDFKLMLARLGPTRPEPGVKPERVMFQGEWDLENRTIAWKKMAISAMRPGRPADSEEDLRAPESFEMVISESGAITIQYRDQAADQQGISGQAVARLGKPFVDAPASKKTSFDTFAEVSEPRVKRCLPPGAKDITLQRERGGHFASYTVSEADLHRFLNDLWEAEGDNSAHQRDAMHGEGEPAKQEELVKRFERVGWKPLKSAVIYYSPSKASGAMTTYYFDKEAGVVYHDTGYW